MRIDAHQHFWNYSAAEYPWIGAGLERLARDYLPSDLEPLLAAKQIDGSVAVQARQSVEESLWLLALAKAHPHVKGVVGWVDLESEDVAEILAELRAAGPLAGVRVMLHRLDDVSWITRPAVDRGLRALQKAGLSLDLITEPRHIDAVREALIAVPELRAIVNHGATPPIAGGVFEPWATDLTRLARDTTAWCKFSGLREVAGTDPSDERILPYARHMLDAFGPRRLLYASNWPVCDLAGGHAQWWASAHAILDRLGMLGADREAMFGGNALQAYRRGSV